MIEKQKTAEVLSDARAVRQPAFTIEISAVEATIENEIEQGCTQKQIAMTYGLALRSSWPTAWAKVNKMILKRWSMSGLERIKKMAWSGKCFQDA